MRSVLKSKYADSKDHLVNLTFDLNGDNFSDPITYRQKSAKICKNNLGDVLAFVGPFLWRICLNNKFKSFGELFWSFLV